MAPPMWWVWFIHHRKSDFCWSSGRYERTSCWLHIGKLLTWELREKRCMYTQMQRQSDPGLSSLENSFSRRQNQYDFVLNFTEKVGALLRKLGSKIRRMRLKWLKLVCLTFLAPISSVRRSRVSEDRTQLD